MAGCDVRLREYILSFRFRLRDICSWFSFYGFGLKFYPLYLGTVQTSSKELLALLLPSSVFLYSRIFEDVNDSSMEILLSCLYIQNSTSSDGSDGIHFANIWAFFKIFQAQKTLAFLATGKDFSLLKKNLGTNTDKTSMLQVFLRDVVPITILSTKKII